MNKILENLKLFFTNIRNIAIIVAIILGIMYISKCTRDQSKFESYDRTVAALNDSITKVINKKGDTVYIERVVAFDLKDILNSEAYKKLSKEKQQFLRDLLGVKGLLSAAQVTIQSKDEEITTLKYILGQYQNDSMVCFEKGIDTIPFKSQLGKSLQYNEKIWFTDKINRRFDYSYKVKLLSTYTKEKDGSIIITHQLDDPKANIIEGMAYTIPSVDKVPRTKVGKWLQKNKIVAYTAAGFLGGIAIGSVANIGK